MANGCPMMKARTQSEHPCFGGDHSKAGRIHLPVAPGCNIKCGFCERRFDCANESRLGPDPEVLHGASFTVNVDHHHDNSRFGDVDLVVATASSTWPRSSPSAAPVFGFTSKRGKLLLEISSRMRWPALKTFEVG